MHYAKIHSWDTLVKVYGKPTALGHIFIDDTWFQHGLNKTLPADRIIPIEPHPYNPLWFIYYDHKGLKWTVPHSSVETLYTDDPRKTITEDISYGTTRTLRF